MSEKVRLSHTTICKKQHWTEDLTLKLKAPRSLGKKSYDTRSGSGLKTEKQKQGNETVKDNKTLDFKNG